MYKHRSALILIAFGLFLTAEFAAFLPGVRNRLLHPFTKPHVTFFSSASGGFADDSTRENFKYIIAADEHKTIRLLVLYDLPGTSTRPSQPPVPVTFRLNLAVPSDNGLWINGQEQTLNPGLNVFYFNNTIYGRVNVTPAEARRVTDIENWSQAEMRNFAATLAQRLAASPTPRQSSTGH